MSGFLRVSSFTRLFRGAVLGVFALVIVGGCATTDSAPSALPECRIALGSTSANASPETRRQDAIAARAALATSGIRARALALDGAGNRVIEELLWECERASRVD